MRRNSTIKAAPTRQPAAEGADVVFDPTTHDFLAYSHGQLVGIKSNSQDAWITARTVYFDTLEQTAIDTADQEAEITESPELAARISEWDTAVGIQQEAFESGRNSMLHSLIAYVKTINPDPDVQVEHHVCDDEEDGPLTYTNYTCDGLKIADDKGDCYDVSCLIDPDLIMRPSKDGTYTLRGYTTLEDLKRLRKALWAIVAKIEEDAELAAPTVQEVA